MPPTLVFIDTNILLDFYRAREKAGLSMLSKIDDHHAAIITSDQVQMEFKKNRQKEILSSCPDFKPELGGLTPPLFLLDSKQKKRLQSGRQRLKEQAEHLRDRLRKVLDEPSRYDPVFMACQRLFQNKSPLNLVRGMPVRLDIRELAKERFILGSPPRKGRDTTIGDAVNWEWVIYCAKANGADVVLVSRDSDYGSRYDKWLFVNDWLREEFKARVGEQRKVFLTERLTDAFKRAAITVTRAEEAAEDVLIQERPVFTGSGGVLANLGFGGVGWTGYMRNVVCSNCGHSFLAQQTGLLGRDVECPNCHEVKHLTL